MDVKSVLYGTILFVAMHICVWVSTNLQFVKPELRDKSIIVSLCLAIPTTLLAYYAARFLYDGLEETLWSVRFIGFGVSYFVFPILTWSIMGESMFTVKTMLCVFLSLVIVGIQLFWPT